MKKIALKAVDGTVYSGELVNDNSDFITIKNIRYHSDVSIKFYVPNLKQEGCEYNGEVTFFRRNIIWISYQ